ncbi:UBC-like protein [Mucor ambiguus]|uniref:UBC-like protein n=1 Tax=Mucor ambiguus TaxID=91626 RepID=A0A0C9LR09_9FUNG|nr:UBC-like protein [Mucor ambiguus]
MDSFNTTPKRTSSLQHAVMNAGSKRSLLDRTKSATFGRIGKRLSQPQEPSSSSHFLHSIYDEEDEDGLGEPIPKAPRLTSEHFSRYEIMTELINLRNPSHCPLGVYVMPSTEDLHVWYGVLFVHKGFYRSGTFKFRLTLPENYPNQPPSITLLTDLFHPLVDVKGNVCISQQFPVWRPYQDYTFHVLHYLKNMFKKVVLDGLNDKYCYNKEAYRLYRHDIAIFAKLAHQSAQLSITESFLYDHPEDDNPIRFSPLSDAKFDELKAQMLSSAVKSTPITPTDDDATELSS